MVWSNSARGQMSWPIHGVCKFHRRKKTPCPGVDTRSGTLRTRSDAGNAEKQRAGRYQKRNAENAERRGERGEKQSGSDNALLCVLRAPLRVEPFVRRWARNGCPSPMATDRDIPEPGLVDTRSGTQKTQRDAENAERGKADLRTLFSAFSAPLGVLRVEALARRWARNGCPSPMATDRDIPEPGLVDTRSGTQKTQRDAENAERRKADLKTLFSAFSAHLSVLRVEALARRRARSGRITAMPRLRHGPAMFMAFAGEP
jgi:hypothetical protein